MLEIDHTLLTGAINIDSDSDGNVVIMQNKQEIKLTPSQTLELKNYLQSLSDSIKYVREVGGDRDV